MCMRMLSKGEYIVHTSSYKLTSFLAFFSCVFALAGYFGICRAAQKSWIHAYKLSKWLGKTPEGLVGKAAPKTQPISVAMSWALSGQDS